MGPYSTWGISSNRLTDITAIGRALLLANDKVTAKEILGVTGGGGEGPPGPPGPEGPQGPQGVPGAQGPAGADGAQGPAGADGAQGPQGIQGIPGSAGAPGADGADGAQGPQGDAGPQGIQGAQGNPGSPGSPGADGNDGAQGPQGIQGIQGIQGVQGPPGTANVASARLTADRTTTLATFGNVTDLAIAIPASETWSFEAALTVGCNNTGGSQYTVTVPAGAALRLMVQGNTSSATAWTEIAITTSGANTVTLCTANAQGRMCFLRGVVVNSTNAGNLQVQFRSITAGQTSTCNSNSYLTGRKH